METNRLTKALALGAALLAGTAAETHASGDIALAVGAGKHASGDKFFFAALGDPHQPTHSTGAVLHLLPSGALGLEGRVACLVVTGNRALLKGPILKPAPLAGKTFVLNTVDNDMGGPSGVPDEAGLLVVPADATCPGGAAAATKPFVQGDVVVWSTVANSTPMAAAGPDQTVPLGSMVTLDGSGSTDADGDPLTFAWSLASVPAGSTATLSDPTAVMPTFVADVPGAYAAQLVVNDGTVNSAPDTVTISTLNSAPVANAGGDQTVLVGDTVTLDGSGSTDVDGDPLTFAWSLLSVPAGSAATLSNPTAVTPTLVVDLPGDYVAQLVVHDGTVSSAPDTVTVSTLNSPPVANAGPDQTVLVGDTVTLDGSLSGDPDGDTLAFTWSLLSIPAGSGATLSDPTAVTPTFVADAPGAYVAQLVVNDGTASSAPDTVTVSTLNSRPVAHAGADQTAFVGDTVTLDGSGSTDVDGDPLTFAWSLLSTPPGSAATLTDPAGVAPTFVVDLPGAYVAQLIVNDGTVNSEPDTVTVSTLNSPPVANAGADQTVFVGDTVTLDGSGSSDVDGDSLSYVWSLVSVPPGSAATFSDPTAVMPTFLVDRPGAYVARLVVNDGTVNSEPDTVTVSTLNSPPVANAGADQTVFVGDTVTLDGSGSSDVDGDFLTYAWSLVSVPPGSTATLSDPTAVTPSFAVDLPGAYVAQLVVNDGTVNSAPDTVSISTLNSAPVADAGADQAVFVGDTVFLDGSGSSDVDGDPLTYAWSLVSVPAGSTATLSDPTAVTPSFVVDLPGAYVAQLIVNDGTVNSAPDTVTVSTLNSAPVADAGADQTVLVGDTVTLDGSGSSDADGDALTYSWSLLSTPAGSAASLSDPQAVTPTFVADVFGEYALQLIVNDGTVDSAPDTLTVTATIALDLTPDPLEVTEGLTAAIALGLSAPAPAGGLTVDLSVDDPATATVPASVAVPEGATSADITVTGVAAGTTTLRANAAGVAETTATINVQAGPPITLSNQIVGKDLQMPTAGSLGAPAPAGGVEVTITSADPTGVLLSTTATGAGSASIIRTVPAGATSIPGFFVQALAGTGSVQFTASAPGFNAGTAVVTLNPSGFFINSPAGNFTTTTSSGNTLIGVRVARLDPGTLAIVVNQALRGGLTVGVPVTSSDTSVGVITVSPLMFDGGDTQENTAFDPQAVGTATIAVGTPPGFSTPSNLQQITATVNAPPMNLGNQTIGKDLQVSATVTLGAAAPAGGVEVTITSADPTGVLLSTSATLAGSASITRTVPAGSTSTPAFFIQALAGAGTVQVAATAAGYAADSGTITLNPSGFVISSPGSINTTAQSPNTTIQIRGARLSPTTLNFVINQALRGGMTVEVPVTSSNTTVGVITVSPVVFNGGDLVQATAFDPQEPGTTTIRVVTPGGFSTPANLQQITATVGP